MILGYEQDLGAWCAFSTCSKVTMSRRGEGPVSCVSSSALCTTLLMHMAGSHGNPLAPVLTLLAGVAIGSAGAILLAPRKFFRRAKHAKSNETLAEEQFQIDSRLTQVRHGQTWTPMIPSIRPAGVLALPKKIVSKQYLILICCFT